MNAHGNYHDTFLDKSDNSQDKVIIYQQLRRIVMTVGHLSQKPEEFDRVEPHKGDKDTQYMNGKLIALLLAAQYPTSCKELYQVGTPLEVVWL